MTNSPSDLHLLGKALRARRTAVGLTLEQLADLAAISPGQISRIETGKSQPSYAALLRLRDAVGFDGSDAVAPAARAMPDDGVVARLGALLAVRRALPLGEASAILDTSVGGLRAAGAELAAGLAPVGMTVVEDGETVALLPHRAFAHMAERAVEAETIPRLTTSHIEAIAIVVHTGAVTRRRIDELRKVDSAETVAQLMEWGLLRREGAEGRAPLYRATAKLLEVTGAASLDELQGRLIAGVEHQRSLRTDEARDKDQPPNATLLSTGAPLAPSDDWSDRWRTSTAARRTR